MIGTLFASADQDAEPQIVTPRKRGVTPRQARLIDWLKHPTGLPDHPAIVPEHAAWTAQEIVEQTGLYESRSQCLVDLNALKRTATVSRYGHRWRYEGWLP